MVDTYTVVRSTAVQAPPERVYEQIADFHRWPGWSPWEDLDPGMRRSYTGAEAGPGAIYSWQGNRKAGTGRMEITRADPPSQVDIDLRFEKPWRSHNQTSFSLAPSARGTEVTWSMTGPHSVMSKVMSVVVSMDKMLGKDFDKGLARLKALAESEAS